MITVAALYKFKKIENTQQYKMILNKICKLEKIKGTLLLADEGINGTIAGEKHNIRNIVRKIEGDGLKPLNVKYSFAQTNPFLRLKVKVKKEIVTLGVEKLDAQNAGTRVNPEKWNELISKPDVVVIDTRNTYEIAIGSFEGAINPNTENFRQFPQWAEEELDVGPETPIAMFCTGGIRCEKSTALLKEKGYKNVFHLDGGILKYLEEVPKQSSLWKGTCFVFDERVSLNHELKHGEHILCHACRMPLNEHEQQSEYYEKGVSCPHCADTQSLEQKNRFRERQKQMEIAKERNVKHLAADIAKMKKLKKNES